jgi:DNA-binding protein HU-beta
MKNVIKDLATNYNLTQKLAGEVVEAVVQGILNEILASGKLRITDLGTFVVKTSTARVGRNPKTGEELNIPSKKSVRFTPTKALKDI